MDRALVEHHAPETPGSRHLPRRGICKNFVITPENLYIFKTDLERAVRRVGGSLTAAPADPSEPDEPALDSDMDAARTKDGLKERA